MTDTTLTGHEHERGAPLKETCDNWCKLKLSDYKMNQRGELMELIEKSGTTGIPTDVIREEYEPAGDLIIKHLIESGHYVTKKVGTDNEWTIFKVMIDGKRNEIPKH